MAFDLHIKNIGKLTDAKLRIGRFTVLAGPNNTGKSFVSKILYSLLNSMNANHAEVVLHALTDRIRREHDRLRSAMSEKVRTSSPYTDMEDTIREMEALAAEQSSDNFAEIDRFIANISNMAKELPELLLKIRLSVVKQRPRPAGSLLKDFEKSLVRLQEFFDGMTAEKLTRASIDLRTKENLTRNFQIVESTLLRGNKEGESRFSIPETVEFNLASSDSMFAIRSFDFQKLKRYSKVIYLESLMLWKLKDALEARRLSDQHWRTRREYLDGIPEYFYDLASALRSEDTRDMDFPELHAKLTGKNVLGGKLVISDADQSDAGEILFRENDQNIPRALTATSVINLGILAFLIERRILNKDSFVFMDGPEANLHPAWQVVMAESLFDLAKGGAHVVIATHSIDILKWLEVHAKKNPKDKDLIELNQFSAHGVEDGSRDFFDEKMAHILKELTDPFAKNFIAGI
ncbi:MAG: ATP-binding protein [Gammaproteobacteria bacterium]|nr:ATP-binding protein [Gammaproteobacteria bacterium]